MMARTRKSRQPSANSPAMGETLKATISILLFIHLFIVSTCLSANLVPSILQQRMLSFFRPYAQSLNFELDGTPYFFSHATPRDAEHRIEVRPSKGQSAKPEEWQRIDRGRRGSERFHRYQRLAETLAFYQEDEATTALIAAGVARSYLRQQEISLTELRCTNPMLLPWDAVLENAEEQNEFASQAVVETSYHANVLVAPAGDIRIIKRAKAALEAAPDRNRTDSNYGQ